MNNKQYEQCVSLIALLLACTVPIRSHAQPVYTFSAVDNQPAFVTLNGEVYGNFTWPACWYEWGLTTNYGNTIAAFFPITQYPQNPLPFLAYLTLTNPPATTIYHFRAAASGFGYGGDEIFITPGTPIITNQPQSQTAMPGSTVTFAVGAYGRGINPYFLTLSYQWQLNSVPIASANASTLTLTNVQGSNAGPYTVVVGNGDGSVTSFPASLSLLPLPLLLANCTNGNLVLSWPVTRTNYNLRTSISLQPAGWSNAPALTVTNDDRITATIPVSALNGQQFFELQYP